MMMRFDEMEKRGVSLALMTDAADGDCGRRADPAARERVCNACGIRSEDLVCGSQVHGVNIAIAGESDRGRGVRSGHSAFPDTDALVTNVRGLPLAVFVADCVPVYVVEPVVGCIALVHAGRVGTERGITGLAVQVLQETYGAKPERTYALIGPSAGPCCYEVDEACAKAFAAAIPAYNPAALPKRHLDLWHANAVQLTSAGIPSAHINSSGTCTICSGLFHSHRRCPNGQRNMAFLAL